MDEEELIKSLRESFSTTIEESRRKQFSATRPASEGEIGLAAHSLELRLVDLPDDLTVRELRDACHSIHMRTI